jgi:hypothetical protein
MPPPPGAPPTPEAVLAAQEQMKLRLTMQRQAEAKGGLAKGGHEGGQGGEGGQEGSAGASRRMLRAAAASCCGAEGSGA